jgi:hypothetical protein
VLRDIRCAVDNWEQGDRGAKKPDEILNEYLGEIKWGGHPGWPSKDLVREVKSILLKMEHPSIVQSVAKHFELREREAFWLCLGLGMGGKAVIDMLTDGVERIDETVSKK